MFDDNKKIGIGLTVAGVLFFFLGILLFLDTGLMAVGNVRKPFYCLLSLVPKVATYFKQRSALLIVFFETGS
jgi:hypothetical protein